MATYLLFLVVIATAVSSAPNSTSPASARTEVTPATQHRPSGGCQDATGKTVRDGWVWQRDPCVRCVCKMGQVGCLTIKCSPNKKCSSGERLERKPVECCSRCVQIEGTCRHGGKVHENGRTWSPEDSRNVCRCENGTISCSPAEVKEIEKELDPNDVLADEPQDSSLTSEAGFLLTVTAGQPETLSTQHLSFNTSAAEDRQVVYMITRKLRAPTEGRLIIVGMHHAEVTSFTQEDLVKRRLVYVPPHPEDVHSETVFCFPFAVWQYPQMSRLTREHSFCLKVLPRPASEMSFAMKSPEFNITKGGSMEITSNYLEVENAGDNLRYIVVEAPIHGSLKFISRSSSTKDVTQGFEFGSSELEEGSLLYAHGGMTINTDSIEILATDGWGEASNTYTIDVIPATTPSGSNFTQPQPLVILEGEELRIKSSFLAPVAGGRTPRRGYYTLTTLPSFGKMLLRDEEEGDFPLGLHFAFSSEDVDEGKLLYRAAEEVGLESHTDRMAFNFDTGGSDREQSIELVISVLPVDDRAPNVAVNGEVVVGEGSSEHLPPALITVTDVDTPVQSLHVEITKQPYFGRITVDRGGPSAVPVEGFSVEEFLKGNVRYEQSYSRRVEPIEDVLLFRVTDGVRFSPLTRLNISIDLQNDEPPKIITHSLHVESGRTKLIGKETLLIEDADTDPGSILITITQPPTQGVLRKRLFPWRPLGSGLHLSTNDTVVYRDVMDGLLSYSAVGGAPRKDDFVIFSVTDGNHHEKGKVVVEITYPSGDDRLPPAEIRRPPPTATTTERWKPRHAPPPSPASGRESRSKVAEPPHAFVTPAKVLPTRPVILPTTHSWLGTPKEAGGPGPGRPLLCVPPCHPRHPLYGSTRGICAGVDPDAIRFGWAVSVPIDSRRDSYLPFESLVESTAFSSIRTNVLDPLHFPKRSRVLCSAWLPGGAPIKSEPVTVDGRSTCNGTRGGFSAKLSYVDDAARDGNSLKVELSIPHQDGMVPLVSTHPLSDPDLIMTDPMYRAYHACSNLIPGKGFLAKRGSRSGRWRMYDDLKDGSESPIRIYEYLDLDECTWYFEAWFSVAELLEECGGRMISDLRGAREGRRHLKFQVPLYVSYVLTSSPSKWTTTEHETDMEFSMEYSSLLWKQGIQTKPAMSARLQPKRIAVDDAGRLTVDFTTVTLFPGRFALRDLESRPPRHSFIVPPRHLRGSINLTLELLNTDDRGADGTEQSWKATSDMALEDYSGEYLARLLPCSQTAGGHTPQRNPPHHHCTVGTHVDIPMTVNFRQIGKPEPITYSLETEFYLSKRPPELHFGVNEQEKGIQNTEPAEEMYSPGDEVYGVVMWHPSQDLSSAYKLSIQRLYLCSGKDGYVPAYDPTGEIYGKGPQYGCIQPSRNLEHRFLLLDKLGSQNVNREYHGIPLEVHLASEITELRSILNHSGVDGFAMKVDPLYEIKSGNYWYLQVLYSIGPSRTRSKRSGYPGYPMEYPDGFMKPIKLKWPTQEFHQEVRSETNPWRVSGIAVLGIVLVLVVLKVGASVEPVVQSFSRRVKLFLPSDRKNDRSEQAMPLSSDGSCDS